MNDIKRQKVKRVLGRLLPTPISDDAAFCDGSKMLGGDISQGDALAALRLVGIAQEQLNPIQEVGLGIVVSFLSGAGTGSHLLAHAVGRMMSGETAGSIVEPPRGLVGREDAHAGRGPESPDLGYLAGYVDMLIEMESAP
jgi:hypothetical protein